MVRQLQCARHPGPVKILPISFRSPNDRARDRAGAIRRSHSAARLDDFFFSSTLPRAIWNTSSRSCIGAAIHREVFSPRSLGAQRDGFSIRQGAHGVVEFHKNVARSGSPRGWFRRDRPNGGLPRHIEAVFQFTIQPLGNRLFRGGRRSYGSQVIGAVDTHG